MNCVETLKASNSPGSNTASPSAATATSSDAGITTAPAELATAHAAQMQAEAMSGIVRLTAKPQAEVVQVNQSDAASSERYDPQQPDAATVLAPRSVQEMQFGL